MYFLMIVLCLLICPAASVAIEAHRSHLAFDNLQLIGRWWTFWAVGIRLLLAGIRQTLQPRFTAEEIFGIRDASALPLIREIGFGNLSIGILGVFSLFESTWVLPAALAGGLCYGFAALGHIPGKNKNAKENVAMFSDIFASAILLFFCGKSLI